MNRFPMNLLRLAATFSGAVIISGSAAALPPVFGLWPGDTYASCIAQVRKDCGTDTACYTKNKTRCDKYKHPSAGIFLGSLSEPVLLPRISPTPVAIA